MVAKTFDAKIVLIHVIDTVSYVVSESVQMMAAIAALVVAPLAPSFGSEVT